MERRKYARMSVRLKCRTSVVRSAGHSSANGGNDSSGEICNGETRNMSRNGVLIAWAPGLPQSSLPVVGDRIRVDIELPFDGAHPRRLMYCEGVVVRAENSQRGMTGAAVLTRIEFRDVPAEQLIARRAEPQPAFVM